MNERKGRPGLDRREFLGASALGLAGISALGARTLAAGTQAPASRAKNVILMVSDGTSIGALSIASLVSRHKYGRELRWLDWMADGARTSLLNTEPAEGHVTDSAAAASAWGIGERVRNGVVCVTPDGREPTPLGARAKQIGRRVGLVTTTDLWDATMSCFVANCPDRKRSRTITEQMLTRGFDVGLGGGRLVFDELEPEKRGYRVARSRSELGALMKGEGPALGLFAPGMMAYTLDRPAEEPTLTEMTQAAIGRLSSLGDPFFLVVEGARVDHAAHHTDAGALASEMIEMDRAIGAALDYAQGRDDTLVIATTDHGNGNPGFTNHSSTIEQVERVASAKHSFAWALSQWRALAGPARTPAALAELIEQAIGGSFSKRDMEFFDRWIGGEMIDPTVHRNRELSPIGAIAANYYGVSFTGPDHTSDHVILTAQGPGSELFPAVGHHTAVHDALAEVMGL